MGMFLGIASLVAAIVFIVSMIVLLIKKNKSWKKCLWAISACIILFIAGIVISSTENSQEDPIGLAILAGILISLLIVFLFCGNSKKEKDAVSESPAKKKIFHTRECAMCGGECGLTPVQLKDRTIICSSCSKKAKLGGLDFIPATVTLNDVKDFMVRIEAEDSGAFTPTKAISRYLKVDDISKKWVANGKIFDYEDIVSFELLEDGESITKGGVGSAVAGGLLFGGVGAIAGSVVGKKKTNQVCSSLKIKITVRNMNNPTVYINFIYRKLQTNSTMYKNLYRCAQECLSLLQLICDENLAKINRSQDNTSNGSADEILKYKNLLDMGAISQEEFDAKKKQLLGL